MKEFGIVASINILAIFLLSLFIIPIVYSYMAIPKYKHLKHLNKQWISGFVNWMERMVRSIAFPFMESPLPCYVPVLLVFTISSFQVVWLKTCSQEKPFTQDIKFFEKEYLWRHHAHGNPYWYQNEKKGYELGHAKTHGGTPKFHERNSRTLKPLSVVSLVKYSKQAYYNDNPEYYQLPNGQERTFILSYAKIAPRTIQLALQLRRLYGTICADYNLYKRYPNRAFRSNWRRSTQQGF